MELNNMPYENREAVPLYYYPFLSPLTCTAKPEDVEEYSSRLNNDKKHNGKTLLYFHIPYCKNICFFCAFCRDVWNKDIGILRQYVKNVKKEIKQYSNKSYIQGRKITSIYFGGGTPSLLPPELIEDLLSYVFKSFKIENDVELSFEGEVRTLKDKKRLKVLKELGCSRVSFGVQTFNERARKLSGILSTQDDIKECIQNVGEFGYDVNLDLMYGLPGQSHDTWANDIETAIDLGSSNVDIYDTVLYQSTTLFRMRHKLKNDLPTESDRIKMLIYAIKRLSDADFHQETIEDFAKQDKQYIMKRLLYGGGDGRSEIIAIGAGSVGVVNGYSYRNFPTNEYLNWSNGNGDRSLPMQLIYKMNQEDFYKRALLFFPKVLGMKKNDVDQDWLEQFRPTLNSMKERELIEENETDITPTPKGLIWTDNIAMEFVNAKEQQKIWKIVK